MYIDAPLYYDSLDAPPSLEAVETRIQSYMNRLEDTVLSSAIQYHFRSGGSRTRARLALHSAHSLSLENEDCITLACIPEIFHNASLIHDDLQDRDPVRRNRKSLWHKYNSATAICAGDYLISLAYGAATDLSANIDQKSILRFMHAKITDIVQGQALDLALDPAQTFDDPEAYARIAELKSGSLLSLTLCLPLLAAAQDRHLKTGEAICKSYALAYQIYDDMKDVAQDQSKIGTVSGLNYVTLLQNRRVKDAIGQAGSDALMHIARAFETLHALSLPCTPVFESELQKLRNRITAFA